MQKSISQALEKWNYDESVLNEQSQMDSQGKVKVRQDKMLNIFQLKKFARSPSSAQAIYEEKILTGRDLFNLEGQMREEVQEMINRRKKGRRSQLR